MFKVTIIIGSLHQASLNRKLAHAIMHLAHPLLNCSISEIDDIPLYNQDHEVNLPSPVARLKQEVRDSDAVLWVTPEYNRSIPGVLKNVIDWGTRPVGQSVWDGKLMAVIGTSPGAIGTAVAQEHLRSIMVPLGAIVLGRPEVYLVYPEGLINDQFEITIPATREFLQKFVEQFAQNIKKYS